MYFLSLNGIIIASLGPAPRITIRLLYREIMGVAMGEPGGAERLSQLCFLSLETDLTRRMQSTPGLVVTALKKLNSS